MLTIGIDDAGRGPVLGSMFMAGVLVDDAAEKVLKEHKVRDSKQYLHNSHRIKVSSLIKDIAKDFKVVKSSPEEIDSLLLGGTNLNTVEAIKTAEIINTLNTKKDKIKVYIDCPSPNIRKWRNELLLLIEHPENLQIECEHKADVNHVSASAASILAKVTREEEVEKLQEKYCKYGNMGSGYPADPDTKAFLKKHGKELANSGLFRKTWSTWKALFPEAKQGTLKI